MLWEAWLHSLRKNSEISRWSFEGRGFNELRKNSDSRRSWEGPDFSRAAKPPNVLALKRLRQAFRVLDESFRSLFCAKGNHDFRANGQVALGRQIL